MRLMTTCSAMMIAFTAGTGQAIAQTRYDVGLLQGTTRTSEEGAALGGPPPLERFVEASSADERIAKTALERIAEGWKDSYTAMIVDMPRQMRPPRRSAEETAGPRGVSPNRTSSSSANRGRVCRECRPIVHSGSGGTRSFRIPR